MYKCNSEDYGNNFLVCFKFYVPFYQAIRLHCYILEGNLIHKFLYSSFDCCIFLLPPVFLPESPAWTGLRRMRFISTIKMVAVFFSLLPTLSLSWNLAPFQRKNLRFLSPGFALLFSCRSLFSYFSSYRSYLLLNLLIYLFLYGTHILYHLLSLLMWENNIRGSKLSLVLNLTFCTPEDEGERIMLFNTFSAQL